MVNISLHISFQEFSKCSSWIPKHPCTYDMSHAHQIQVQNEVGVTSSDVSTDDSKENGSTLTDEMLASLSGMGIDMATDSDNDCRLSVMTDASYQSDIDGLQIITIRKGLVVMIGIGTYTNGGVLGDLIGVSTDYKNMIQLFVQHMEYSFIYQTNKNKIVYLDKLRLKQKNNNYQTNFKLKWNADEIDLFVLNVKKIIETIKPDGLIFLISSHGDRDRMIIDSEFEEYSLIFILSQFWNTKNGCPYLADKPKIFFLDMCQGGKKPLPTGIKKKIQNKNTKTKIQAIQTKGKFRLDTVTVTPTTTTTTKNTSNYSNNDNDNSNNTGSNKINQDNTSDHDTENEIETVFTQEQDQTKRANIFKKNKEDKMEQVSKKCCNWSCFCCCKCNCACVQNCCNKNRIQNDDAIPNHNENEIRNTNIMDNKEMYIDLHTNTNTVSPCDAAISTIIMNTNTTITNSKLDKNISTYNNSLVEMSNDTNNTTTTTNNNNNNNDNDSKNNTDKYLDQENFCLVFGNLESYAVLDGGEKGGYLLRALKTVLKQKNYFHIPLNQIIQLIGQETLRLVKSEKQKYKIDYKPSNSDVRQIIEYQSNIHHCVYFGKMENDFKVDNQFRFNKYLDLQNKKLSNAFKFGSKPHNSADGYVLCFAISYCFVLLYTTSDNFFLFFFFDL